MGSSSSCSDTDSSYCFNRSDGSIDLNLYRVFIFSVPIFFTFVLFFFFYLFCLRPRRLHWTTPFGIPNHELDNAISTSHSGLDKELREMLPILVYNESFSVKDTLCSVCLLEYQAEDRLQQIPACGHTFHMSCIDLWLASHSTCPLCRLSLLTSIKSSTDTSNVPVDRPHNDEETQAMELSESRPTSTRHQETTVLQSVSGEVAISAPHIDAEGPNVLISQ